MKFFIPFFALSLAALSATALASSEGEAAISTIGQINGIALACQQPAIVSRARNAVQTTAPKTRSHGEIFENATNAAYLEQGKEQPCPDAATLSRQLHSAEQRLQAAFPTIR